MSRLNVPFSCTRKWRGASFSSLSRRRSGPLALWTPEMRGVVSAWVMGFGEVAAAVVLRG
eukprot:scaffold111783_cov63-Phaeocystis_antarctica.AAC.5